MGRPRGPGLVALLMTVSVVASAGCAVARSAGGGFADGALVRLKEDTTLTALSRELTDSVGEALGREFDRAVLSPARTTWREMRGAVRQDADSMRSDVGAWVGGDLNAALGQVLKDNADVLASRLPAVADSTADALTAAFARGMLEGMAPVADSLVIGILRATAAGIDGELRPALHSLMLDVRDSLQLRIKDVDQAVADSKSLSGLRAMLFGAGLAALLASLVVAFGQRRRHARALHALIDAIDAAEDDEVREKARIFARKAGVHGWLSDRVEDRRSCRPEFPSEGGEYDTR